MSDPLRLTLFADLHLTNSNSKFRKDDRGVSDLLKAQGEFMYDMIDKEHQQSDVFVNLGDFTDKETLSPITLYKAARIYSALHFYDEVDTYHVVGNHAVYDKAGVFSVLAALASANESDDAVKSRIVCEEYGDVQLHFFPYRSDEKKLAEDIREVNASVPDDKRAFGFFHFGISGALLDNGMESPSGVPLKREDVDQFEAVFGGDYHRPQQVYDNLYYVGAPFEMKYGEYNEQRGYMTVDIHDNGYDIQRHANDLKKPIRDLSIQGAIELAKTPDVAQDTLVRLTEPVPSDKRAEWRSAKDAFYHVSEPARQTGVQDEEDLDVQISDEDEADDDQLFRRFLAQHCSDLTDQDREELMKLFDDILSS